MRRTDAVIVGAGPAGSTAAILLAQVGAKVVLLDRARFPRDKLCGEFVSPEAIRVLARAGVLVRLAPSAGRAREAVITDAAGRSLRMPIPVPAGTPAEALGIRRRDLDLALVEEAARLGVEVVQGFEARRLLFADGRAVGVSGAARGAADQGSGTVFEARFVIGADGRDSVLARLADPARPRGRGRARFGLKAHFRGVAWPGGAVELHYFRGGYLGLQDVGGGTVNACALIDRELTGPLPRDPDGILRSLCHRNPHARQRLEGAGRVSDWQAAGSLFFGAGRPVLAGAILAGDAAGTIDPFAGEGMSMAFRSGELAAEEILRALDSGGDPLALERYERRWKAEFSRRIALCRRLGWLAVRPAFQTPMLALLRSLPPLGRTLARSTRTGAWHERG